MPANPYAQRPGFGMPDSTNGLTVGMASTDFYDRRTIVAVYGETAVTVFTTTASTGQLFDYEAAVSWIGGSVTAGTYILGWTTGGNAFTATVNAAGYHSAATGYGAITGVFAPDPSTVVTVQVGTVSGTGTILVKAVFSRML